MDYSLSPIFTRKSTKNPKVQKVTQVFHIFHLVAPVINTCKGTVIDI